MENKKYTVYENDLKFKNMRHLDTDKIMWASEDVKLLSTKDMDTITYRLKQSKQGGFESLDFSRLNLKTFPDLTSYNHYLELKNLKYLFLDNNFLTICDESIKYFKYLEVLDISFNKITDILYLPPYLKELNCSSNLLKSIGHHNSLERMDCSTNKIELLGIYPNLIDLICFDNKLNKIHQHSNLNRLICNNNPIATIDDQPVLTQLNCSETKIEKKISNIPNLITLVCNNTKITDVSNFSKLETLEMVGTNITIPYIKTLKTLLCKNYEDIRISTKYIVEREITEGENSCVIFKTTI